MPYLYPLIRATLLFREDLRKAKFQANHIQTLSFFFGTALYLLDLGVISEYLNMMSSGWIRTI